MMNVYESRDNEYNLNSIWEDNQYLQNEGQVGWIDNNYNDAFPIETKEKPQPTRYSRMLNPIIYTLLHFLLTWGLIGTSLVLSMATFQTNLTVKIYTAVIVVITLPMIRKEKYIVTNIWENLIVEIFMLAIIYGVMYKSSNNSEYLNTTYWFLVKIEFLLRIVPIIIVSLTRDMLKLLDVSITKLKDKQNNTEELEYSINNINDYSYQQNSEEEYNNINSGYGNQEMYNQPMQNNQQQTEYGQTQHSDLFNENSIYYVNNIIEDEGTEENY